MHLKLYIWSWTCFCYYIILFHSPKIGGIHFFLKGLVITQWSELPVHELMTPYTYIWLDAENWFMELIACYAKHEQLGFVEFACFLVRDTCIWHIFQGRQVMLTNAHWCCKSNHDSAMFGLPWTQRHGIVLISEMHCVSTIWPIQRSPSISGLNPSLVWILSFIYWAWRQRY